jgi:hypothetical protein
LSFIGGQSWRPGGFLYRELGRRFGQGDSVRSAGVELANQAADTPNLFAPVLGNGLQPRQEVGTSPAGDAQLSQLSARPMRLQPQLAQQL